MGFFWLWFGSLKLVLTLLLLLEPFLLLLEARLLAGRAFFGRKRLWQRRHAMLNPPIGIRFWRE